MYTIRTIKTRNQTCDVTEGVMQSEENFSNTATGTLQKICRSDS